MRREAFGGDEQGARAGSRFVADDLATLDGGVSRAIVQPRGRSKSLEGELLGLEHPPHIRFQGSVLGAQQVERGCPEAQADDKDSHGASMPR